MLSVDQAIRAVHERARPLPARWFTIGEAAGLTLGESITADIDMPPFDKALMDGYAVRSDDLAAPSERRLRVVDEIHAGRSPDRALAAGEAARIMTGAPLPPGADAVVMVEKTRAVDDGWIAVDGPVMPGQSRLGRGREMKAGDALFGPGARIGPAGVGLIASAGRNRVLAIPRPTIRVVPTGDELVRVDRQPGPGQIRNTNGAMLASFARAWGASDVAEMPIAPDQPEALRSVLGGALARSDVLLISGGVSAGARDLVPEALLGLGVEPVFHKVRVKPGKPIWFGVLPRPDAGPPRLVFGLPGNPVGAVVGFLLFVRPALDALAGRQPAPTGLISTTLAAPFPHRGDRPTFHPARIVEGRAFPLDWAGSADLRTVALADGFLAFPAGDRSYQEGEVIPFLGL